MRGVLFHFSLTCSFLCVLLFTEPKEGWSAGSRSVPTIPYMAPDYGWVIPPSGGERVYAYNANVLLRLMILRQTRPLTLVEQEQYATAHLGPPQVDTSRPRQPRIAPIPSPMASTITLPVVRRPMLAFHRSQ